MKTCKSCKKEFNENLTFCPFCGAENSDRKLTYIERKKAREKDTELLLSKASIQQEDIDNAKEFDENKIGLEKVQEIKKARLYSILRVAISLIAFISCIICAELTLKGDINANIKLLIIVVAFFAVAFVASIFISDTYTIIALKKIEKGEFVPMKVYFTKGPIVAYNGILYEIKALDKCPSCGEEVHVEEMDGELYCVCNKTRDHIYKVDKNKYIEQVKLKIEQKE